MNPASAPASFVTSERNRPTMGPSGAPARLPSTSAWRVAYPYALCSGSIRPITVSTIAVMVVTEMWGTLCGCGQALSAGGAAPPPAVLVGGAGLAPKSAPTSVTACEKTQVGFNSSCPAAAVASPARWSIRSCIVAASIRATMSKRACASSEHALLTASTGTTASRPSLVFNSM
eukprot:10084554-Alexandrium_andersonii.AAC.1